MLDFKRQGPQRFLLAFYMGHVSVSTEVHGYNCKILDILKKS